MVAEADFQPGDLVIDIGAGAGAFTDALLARNLNVIAVEVDPGWAEKLRQRHRKLPRHRLHVLERDFLSVRLPRETYRVIGSLPFSRTTDILRHLLDNPTTGPDRADVIVQWEVARKRATVPPTNLRSTAWAPWWMFELGKRWPAKSFRPVPKVDGGVLTVRRRVPPELPAKMAAPYSKFIEQNWPF